MHWIVLGIVATMLLAGCRTPPPRNEQPQGGGGGVVVEKDTPVDEALRAALGQLQRRQLDGAQISVNRVLVGHPEHLETRVLQAMVLEARGQAADAAGVWNQIERALVYQGKLEPFVLEETLENAALHYVKLDRPDRARIFLDELWRRFPGGEVTARAQLRAAELDAAAQRWGISIQRCSELIRARAGHPAAEQCGRLSRAAGRMLELGPEPPADARAWSWENPRPQGNTLRHVWVTPKGEATAIGDAGTILHRAAGDKTFKPVASPTRWSLHHIWGTDSGELWAVGAAGIILHFDNTERRRGGERGPREAAATNNGTWRVTRPANPEEPDLWGVWAGGGQVVAVGEGGVVVSGREGNWSVQRLAQPSLRAVWGDGERLLAVGDGGTLLQRTGQKLWQPLGSDCYEDLWSIWGARGGPVWLAGNRRTVVRVDGARAKESVVGRSNFRDVWGLDAKQAWAVGTAGDVVGYRDGKWRSEESGTLLQLNGVSGRAGELWAVGEGGTMLQRKGNRWSTVSEGAHQDLVAVTAAAGGLALGDRGLLLRRSNGGRWTPEPPLPAGRYRDLWGDHQRQIAVGDRGLLVMRSGRGPWRVIATDVADDLSSVCGFEGGAVAVGTGGTLLRLEGERVIKDSSPTGLDLRAVWASSPRQIIAVGNRGTILGFDGERWRAQDSGTLADLLAVWAPSRGPALAAGKAGTLLQQENARWRARRMPLQQNLVDLWGSSSSRVFAVSDRGSIAAFDGQSWKLQRSPSSCLAAVHGDAGAGSTWAVGCHGTILASPDRRPPR